MQRGSGILNNELYAGRLVWNKVRMVKDPDTGRRISRPNAESEWQATDVPSLAIVGRELFEAAQERKRARSATHPNQQRRPRHILSGLLKCGACGAGMASNGKDPSGRIRIRCSAATESGTCPDPKTFYLETVEAAVLNGLTAELRNPEVIAEYVRAYHAERKRLAAEANRKRSRLERQLGELTREIDRLVDASAKGQGDPAVLGPKSTLLDVERRRITAELAETVPTTETVALHPAMVARYEEQLTRLQAALADGVRGGDTECSEAIRDLVETITVFRDSTRAGGVQVEISGRLTALLGEQAYPNRVRGVWGKMVAEEGFEPPTQGL